MLGSLTFYRRMLKDNVFSNPTIQTITRVSNHTIQQASGQIETRLPAFGHGIAGILAGCTVSFVAAPVEHIKARLQIQYAAQKSQRLFSGPIDCFQKIVSATTPQSNLSSHRLHGQMLTFSLQYRSHGIRGVYRGLNATLFFRSFFFFWWGSYDLLTTFFSTQTSLSTPSVNFWAGGLSAQVYWLTAYPADVVKQRIMADPLGGKLRDGQRQFYSWKDAARAIVVRDGWKGYWRGFTPCFLRAFPANAMALVAFEGVMRAL